MQARMRLDCWARLFTCAHPPGPRPLGTWMTIVIVAGCMSFSVGCSKTERTEIDDTSGGSSSQTDSGTPVGALPDGTEADAGGEETPAEAFPECPRNLIQGFAPNDTLPVVTTSQFDEYADCIRACPQGSNSCYMACPYFEEVDSCLLNQTASCSTQEGALCRSKHETTECCASDRMCGFSIQCVLDNCHANDPQNTDKRTK